MMISTTDETLPLDTPQALADVEASLPEHLAWLPGGRPWAQWRWMGLRAPGFPAARALTLAAPQGAARADRLLQAEEQARQAREQARAAIDQALAALRRDQQWQDSEKREPLVRALRQLKKGRLPQPENLDGLDLGLFDAIRAADAAA